MNDFLRKFLIKFHVVIPIILIVLPLTLPVYILRYIFYLPILLPVIWLKYGGCPITHLEKVDNKDTKDSTGSFTQRLLKPMLGELSDTQTEHISTIHLLLSVIISAIRFI